MKNETDATVIAFPGCAAPSAGRVPRRAEPAQILFFTGVRIERHTDESVEIAASPRRKGGSALPSRPSRQRRRS